MMDSVAGSDAAGRRDLFIETANRRGLSPQIIEKDFWVCWALKQTFELPDIGRNVIFKGGTSLSKVFGLIQRFSEDVDISIRRDYLGFSGAADPEQANTKSQRQKQVGALRKKCRDVVQAEIKEQLAGSFVAILGAQIWTLCADRNDDNTLNFTHPNAASGDGSGGADYVAPAVKLEFGAGSDPYPIGEYPVYPYAAEEFPLYFTTPACSVIALEAERTFWEKATVLPAEYHRPEDKPTPIRMSRHYYDIVQVAKSAIGQNAIENLELLKRVVHHKSIYFACSWAHYETAQPGTFHIVPSASRIADVRHDYANMKDMFFGQYPEFDDLVADVAALEERLNAV